MARPPARTRSRTTKRTRTTADRLVDGVVFRPATSDRWDDVVNLFGPRGACAGCWCMWPRLTSRDYTAGRGDGHRRRLRALVAADRQPGILAYAGDQPVGWCAVAPRVEYTRLSTSRVMAPIDDREVWSVPCLFVANEWRGRGLPARLLEAAVRFAGSQGARIVEGYPIDTQGRRTGAAFLWHGTATSFLRAGFTEVARRSATRPVMRRNVRPTAAKRASQARRG